MSMREEIEEWLDHYHSPPPMQNILLSVGGKVISGWNESVQPEEEPSYCSYEPWPEPYVSGEGVTHWRHMPKPPEKAP